MKKKQILAIVIPAITLLLVTACTSSVKKNTSNGNSKDIDPDSVLFSFVFMGCNRIDWKDTANANTNASTANLPELQHTFNEVCKLSPKPDLFFFLGDLVLGLDSPKLQNQLKAWVSQYNNAAFSSIAKSDIKMIALPGNHEMLYMNSEKEETPWIGALPEWLQVMSAFSPDGVINRVSGADSMNNLGTYSFNYKNVHFILMNTDTYNPQLKIGQVPAAWINADMTAAKKSASVQHIFLLGHKPSYVDAPITDPAEFLDTALTNMIWPVMYANKAEAMLSAHSHQYYRTQPQPNSSYQVIAGNGGSPYEKHLGKEDQFFGYTVIYVMKNGKVHLRSMGRSVPDKDYLESVPKNDSTTLRDKADISWGTTANKWNSKVKK